MNAATSTTGTILLVASMLTSGYAQEFAAPYGSRFPPLPLGEGGDLVLTAPTEFCAGDKFELQVRRYEPPDDSGLRDVLRWPAGPSRCEWVIDGLKPASYDVVIRDRSTRQIVATAPKQQIPRGGLSLVRLEKTQVEVVGQITVNGSSQIDGLLVFQASGDYRWEVPLDADGRYRVSLDQGVSDNTCMWLKRARTETIGMVRVGCERFTAGSQRYDRDLHISPGVLRVYVPPLPKPERNDETSLIVVLTYQRSPIAMMESESTVSFKATAGFRGEYFGGDYREYEVSIQTVPDHRIVAKTRVILSADQPIADAQLTIPPDSLTCDEGWWSACPPR
jgi:hypothetical protein